MFRKTVLCLLPLVLLCTTQTATSDEQADPFARDLKILTDWFEGEFDNEEQLWFENDPRSNTPEEERHIRLHTVHTRLDLPTFGEHVFYVEEYKENDPKDIVRQRFVTFESDLEANVIRMKQGFLKDNEAALDAYLNPDKLSQLTEQDIFFMTDLEPDSQCDVFWERIGDQYKGAIPSKGCVFGENEKRRYSVHHMILSANKYWRADASYLISDDSLHVGDPIDSPIKMRRAEIFECEASFTPKDFTSSGNKQHIGPFRIHNQGGKASITRESDGQVFDVLLRKKEYPFYGTRPDFMYFSVRESGAKRSLVYTVNDTDARILGLNHNGMGVHCYRQGYQFRELLEQL